MKNFTKDVKTLKIRRISFSIITNIITYLIAIFIAIVVLAPYMWMVSGSFKKDLEIQSADVTVPKLSPRWIPREVSFNAYIRMNRQVPMLRYLRNSLITSTGTTVTCTIICLFGAYAMSRIRFKWKKPYELALFSTQMFPGIAFLIPYFIMFIYIKKYFGLPMRNTFHGLIFTYATFALPFAILMLRDFLESIPKEIDEQAQIDGCNKFQIIFRIILPLSMPGIVSTAIYSFIMAWNEMLFATQLSGRETKPVSLGLMDYITLNSANWSGMMAACIVASIPVLIIFTFLQKQIVEGHVQSGLKG